ncbi:MAG: peptidylprolyl isomerase [Bacteroidota bacterium]
MYKYLLLLAAGSLLIGCEVRVRDSGANSSLSRRSADTSAVFSISRNNGTTPTRSFDLTESSTSTSIQAEVVSPLPPSNLYEIATPLGNMTLRLFDDTPEHRDNFKKLVENGYYDRTTFHRVMANFIIQGGDPNSRDKDPNNDGIGGPGYTISPEFKSNHFHKKGAIAAARQPDQVNPQRRSSGSQFYIAQGRAYEAQELAEVERYIGIQIRDSNFRFSPEAREAYTRIGGIPTLDMQYTVFGELVDGFDVLDRISAIPVDGRDRPKDDVPMTIRAIPAQ